MTAPPDPQDRLAAGMTFICECGTEDPAYGETHTRRLCQDCLKKYVAGLEARVESLERLRTEERLAEIIVSTRDAALDRAAEVIRAKADKIMEASKIAGTTSSTSTHQRLRREAEEWYEAAAAIRALSTQVDTEIQDKP